MFLLQDLQEKLAIVEHRTGAKGPLEGERTDILLPLLAARKIVRDQVAIAVPEDDHLPVRGGRGAGKGAARILSHPLGQRITPGEV